MNILFCLFLFLISTSCFSQGQDLNALSIAQPIQKDTFTYFYIPDDNLSKYTLGKKFTKPKNWQNIEAERAKGKSWYSGTYPATYTLEQVLTDLRSNSRI